jgi:E3 ubiquitin-protein ligase ATL41
MSGGNGTSSPDNTHGGSSSGHYSTLAYVGIALFLGIVLFFAIYYIKAMIRHWQERLTSPLASPGMAPDADNARLSQNLGLDPENIALLPTFPYQPAKRKCRNKRHEHKEKLSMDDCAVCLAELEEGEMVRVLPTCKHYFHVKCIDMWLSTCSSCPMCRAHPDPDKVRLGLVSISPPWHQPTHSSSSERRQFSFGSCLGSSFVKTPSKSPSPIGTSPFQGSWQGSPNMLAAHTLDISEIREIS